MSLKHYLSILRVDHWTKNVFVLSGAFIASMLLDEQLPGVWWRLLCGLASTCLVASANYVINEWLDADYDRYHPTKQSRPAVLGELKGRWVYAQYAALVIAGIGLGALVSVPFAVTVAGFLVMGIIYNVRPIRAKDRAILDVLVESVNNPIRLALGWFIVTSFPPPPSSLVVAYWMGGAFLMAVKRFGEYRFISNRETAGAYRQSFQRYNEESLLISSFFYAMFCALSLGVFLVKHRIELLLGLPFVVILFAWYLHLAFKPDSPVQHPERLHKEWSFLAYCAFLVVLFVLLFLIDIERMQWFLDKQWEPWS